MFIVSRHFLAPNSLDQLMAVIQELGKVGEKKILQWYFQQNIHEVKLQLNRTNFISVSNLS